MKKILTVFCAMIFIIIGFLYAQGKELTGREIVEKANELLSPETSYGKLKMTIVTTSGNKRTFVYESWSKNEGEKNLIRYQEPRRVKDQAVLMLNNADDIWMYFPRTKRVRKLATHAKKQKMQGSDFSYEDMGSGESFLDDFSAERLEDEEMQDYECYKVELIRKPDSDVSYSRLMMWVIKENFYPLVIDYYDEENPDRKIKRLTQSDIKRIDGIPTAMKMVMKNLNDNTQTEMELLKARYNIELSDHMFTERELRK
ncbi:MAG: outer membrane lipoprotein-sorting protein [bacterium]